MENYSKIIKKFLLPFVFLFLAIYMIPRESYFKKENFLIKIQGKKVDANLQLEPILGYSSEENNYHLKDNEEVSFPNTIRDNYNVLLSGEVAKVEMKSDAGKKIELKNISSLYKKKEFRNLYSKSIMNIVSYMFIILLGSYILLKERIYLTSKNLLATSIGLIFLSISFNVSFLSKANAIFFISFIAFLILKRRKIKIDFLCAMCAFLLLFSLLSEYFNLRNFNQAYSSFEKSFMILMIIKMIDFKRKHVEILKKYLYISLIISGFINVLSPLVMSGIYCFQFGALMMVLLGMCVEGNLDLKIKNKIISYGIRILIFIIAIYGIINSERRTIWLILVVYFCLKIIQLIVKSSIRNRIKIVILILSALFILNFSYFKEKDKLKKQFLSITDIKETSNSQRLLMWKKSFYVLKENIYTGIGIGNFYNEVIKDKYKSKIDYEKKVEELFQENYGHPHSEYWNQLLMRGGLGGIIYLFILWNLYRGLRLKSKDSDYLIICGIFSIFGLFEPYSLRGESYIFWIFMGLELQPIFINKDKNKVIDDIGWILISLTFVSSLYFSKRFRYYFIITVIVGLIYIWKKKRSKNEKI